jgi:hypothetical protein
MPPVASFCLLGGAIALISASSNIHCQESATSTSRFPVQLVHVSMDAAYMSELLSATPPKTRGPSSATQNRRRAKARLRAALDSNSRTAPRRPDGREATRLAAMLGLPPERALRLAPEIRQLAHGTLYRLPSQRPAAVVREIKAALRRAKAGASRSTSHAKPGQ